MLRYTRSTPTTSTFYMNIFKKYPTPYARTRLKDISGDVSGGRPAPHRPSSDSASRPAKFRACLMRVKARRRNAPPPSRPVSGCASEGIAPKSLKNISRTQPNRNVFFSQPHTPNNASYFKNCQPHVTGGPPGAVLELSAVEVHPK